MYNKINDVDNIDDIWEKDSYVKIKALNKKEIIIEANRKGFFALSKLFRSISEYGINSAENGFDDSYWMDNYCGKIDSDSSNIVLSMIYDKDNLPRK